MNNYDKIEFFNSIAERWDNSIDIEELKKRLREKLRLFGIKPDDKVVDIGCGTGNLTSVILEFLSEYGDIYAVDNAEKMLLMAKCKIGNKSVKWFNCSAEQMDLSDNWADHIFCYSVWPHFDKPENVIKEIRRILKRGGRLYIWHTISRNCVNKIHKSVSKVTRSDILIPARDLASFLKSYGFLPVHIRDDETEYLIVAKRL